MGELIRIPRGKRKLKSGRTVPVEEHYRRASPGRKPPAAPTDPAVLNEHVAAALSEPAAAGSDYRPSAGPTVESRFKPIPGNENGHGGLTGRDVYQWAGLPTDDGPFVGTFSEAETEMMNHCREKLSSLRVHFPGETHGAIYPIRWPRHPVVCDDGTLEMHGECAALPPDSYILEKSISMADDRQPVFSLQATGVQICEFEQTAADFDADLGDLSILDIDDSLPADWLPKVPEAAELWQATGTVSEIAHKYKDGVDLLLGGSRRVRCDSPNVTVTIGEYDIEIVIAGEFDDPKDGQTRAFSATLGHWR